MKEFSVYDAKSETWHAPFVSQTTASGIRLFETHCKNPETQYYGFPNDFTLFETGTWDERSSLHVPHASHINLGLALEFKTKDTD